ncbi:hypothetical protein [Nitrososphaera sp.]
MKAKKSHIATLRGQEALNLLKAMESDGYLQYEDHLVNGRLIMKMFAVDG